MATKAADEATTRRAALKALTALSQAIGMIEALADGDELADTITGLREARDEVLATLYEEA